MNVTPLSVMRVDSGAGNLPEIAKKLGCTRQALSAFENGRTDLSPELVRKYAKLVGLDEFTVRRLFIRSKLQFHRREAARAEAELKELPQRGRALVSAG